MINNIGLNDPQPCDYAPQWEGEIPESPPPPEPPPSPESTPNSPPPNEPPPFQSPPPKSSSSYSSPPHISPPPRHQNTHFGFKFKTSFDVLKIDPCSSKRKVRLAFMVLARECHPDKWDINTSNLNFDKSVEKIQVFIKYIR